MRNILLKALYKISPEKVDLFTSGKMLVDTLHWYQEMHRLSIDSFKKNLKGDWELIELSGNIIGLQSAFQNTMIRAKELWYKHYPCNILYTDCDTLCVHPLSIFNEFEEFRLFSSKPLNLDGYCNCGVRYYPSTLTDEFWKKQDELMLIWEPRKYEAEQNVYNWLMWSQESIKSTFRQYQHHVSLHKEFTISDIQHEITGPYKILHFLSGSHPAETTKLMIYTHNLMSK